MSGDHKSYCDKVLNHERELGGVQSDLQDYKSVKGELFKQTTELRQIATTNQLNITHIKEILDNGITEPLEEKIDLLCKQFTDAKKEMSDHNTHMDKRMQRLEAVSWIPKLMDQGIRKVVGIILAILLFMACANALTWGVFKSYFFKEPPGQQADITKEMQEQFKKWHKEFDQKTE